MLDSQITNERVLATLCARLVLMSCMPGGWQLVFIEFPSKTQTEIKHGQIQYSHDRQTFTPTGSKHCLIQEIPCNALFYIAYCTFQGPCMALFLMRS